MARTTTVIRPNPAGIAALHRHIVLIHRSVVHDVFEDARAGAAVDTGAMRGSIRTRPLRPLLSHVIVDTDHWQFVEYSTAPHVIRPKPPNKALFWPGAPHPVSIVHHPGTHEQPFMRPALYQRRSLRGRP